MNATTQSRRTAKSLPLEPGELWAEALPAPLVAVDADDCVCYVNAAAAALFIGLPRSVIGAPIEEVFGAAAAIGAMLARIRGGVDSAAEYDVPLAGPDGAPYHANILAGPGNRASHVVLLLAPAPRSRASASGYLHAAARTLAHEVRNPLAGIRAAAQLMARDGDTETMSLARLICDEVDRIRRLTDRIDPFDALGPTQLERLNVHEALNRVRALLASSAPKVQLSERFDPSLPPIRGDRDQLIQAFLNIAQNAVDAMADQPHATLALVTRFRTGVKLRSADGLTRSQLEVQFIDNGPGIGKDMAGRVFDAFATTKSKGMGLGLTIAAEIVARHDGEIGVESEPGHTVFTVSLPIGSEKTP